MRVQEKALTIVAILALAALIAIACGASPAAVREVLAATIPAVTALAVHTARRNR
jgi:hypothetical protein